VVLGVRHRIGYHDIMGNKTTIRLIEHAVEPQPKPSRLRARIQSRVSSGHLNLIAAVATASALAAIAFQYTKYDNLATLLLIIFSFMLLLITYLTPFESEWGLSFRRKVWIFGHGVAVTLLVLFAVTTGGVFWSLFSSPRHWDLAGSFSLLAILCPLGVRAFMLPPLTADRAKLELDGRRLGRGRAFQLYTLYYVPFVWLGVLEFALSWVWWKHSQGLELGVAVALSALITPATVAGVWRGLGRQLRVATTVVEAADSLIAAASDKGACLTEAGLALERALGVGIDCGLPFMSIPVADKRIRATLRQYVFAAAGRPNLAFPPHGHEVGKPGIEMSDEKIREHLIEFAAYVRYLFVRYVDIAG